MEKWVTYIVTTEEEGKSLQNVLRAGLHLSAKEISRAKFREGGICVNGERRKVNAKVQAGDRIEVLLETKEEASGQLVGCAGNLKILYEDNDLIVVDKPAGLVVHPTGAYYADTLANHLAAYLREKDEDSVIRILGRLDKDTSGVVLAVKNRAAGARLECQRENGELVKTYLAVTEGVPQPLSGWIRTPIGPDPERKGRMKVYPEAGVAFLDQSENAGAVSLSRLENAGEAKSAVTWYEVLEQREGRALVRLQLQTGRIHQIRVHMASVGCPLVGDPFYGRNASGADLPFRSGRNTQQERMALHAVSLEFRQPFTGELIKVEAPPEEGMCSLF